MRFYSIYDLIDYVAGEHNLSSDSIESFFRKRHIKKSSLVALQQTSYIPSDKMLREAIEEFLGMNELEINLSMGHIPKDYRESYFQNISQIAQLLTKDQVVMQRFNSEPYYENEVGKLYHGD